VFLDCVEEHDAMPPFAARGHPRFLATTATAVTRVAAAAVVADSGSSLAALAGVHATVEDTLVDGDKLAGRPPGGRCTLDRSSVLPLPGGRSNSPRSHRLVRRRTRRRVVGTGELLTALIQLGATIRRWWTYR
jgi:hypothetical protein